MAKRETASASARTQPAQTVQIETRPAPEASEAISLRREAAGMMVHDRDSHAEALEFVRGCKQLKRKIEDHWSRITRSVDDLKRNLLTMKRADLEPVETALAMVERRALDYAEEQARREREQAERDRQERERKAREERERELAEREAAALEAEQSSPALSERERVFVEQMVAGAFSSTRCAQIAGYKDPEAAAIRLFKTDKIQKAINARKEAIAIRQQAEETARQPIVAARATPAPSQVARSAGVRTVTTRSAEVIDLDKLIDGVIAGTVPRGALMANQTFLNSEAKQLQDSFESVYPGCRLVVKTGLAG